MAKIWGVGRLGRLAYNSLLYAINDESSVPRMRPDNMYILVKTLDDKTITLEVKSSDTIDMSRSRPRTRRVFPRTRRVSPWSSRSFRSLISLSICNRMDNVE